MTVTIYKSTDASAPALDGQVGSLLNVLDACLVNGYGAKSAAGWSKPYANSGNKGCYRMGTTGNTGFYLTVDDSGPGAGGAREARVTGWQTLTSLTGGTLPFPVYAQIAIGTAGAQGSVIWRKSATANSTTRPWVLIADDSCFYLFVDSGDMTSPIAYYGYFFGDIFSYKNSDAYRCMLIGNTGENVTYNYHPFPAMPNNMFLLHKGVPGHFIASRENGLGSSIFVGKHWWAQPVMPTGWGGAQEAADFAAWPTPNGTSAASNNQHFSMGASFYSPGAFPYPNGPDGNLYISPVWVHHNGSIRGYMKGLWVPLHDRVLTHLDEVPGTGNMSGKTFTNIGILGYAHNTGLGSYTQGNVLVETSNTWS